jgi:Suppressor of forked protein (Suf)
MRDLYPEDDVGLKHFAQRHISRNFDPTTVRLIVSPTQTKATAYVYPSIEREQSINNSPPTRLSDTVATNSPKRPLPIDEVEDNQPRKFARGESPLKGAAGRRMNQQSRTLGANGNFQPTPLSHVQVPPPPPLPGHLAFLLSIIPKASTYEFRRFDPSKMVDLLRNVQIPSSVPVRQAPPPPPPPPQGQQWPPYPPQSQQQPHQQPPMMPPGMPPGVPGMVPPPYAGKHNPVCINPQVVLQSMSSSISSLAVDFAQIMAVMANPECRKLQILVHLAGMMTRGFRGLCDPASKHGVLAKTIQTYSTGQQPVLLL